MTTATVDTASVDHVLSTTRAVRRKLDLDRPVEPHVLATCLRLSTYAPSPGNQQSWRWLVVRDATAARGWAGCSATSAASTWPGSAPSSARRPRCRPCAGWSARCST